MESSHRPYLNLIRALTCGFIFLFSSATALAADGIAGEKLFKQKCASCHKIDKKLIGPPMDTAIDNWGGDMEGIYTWVRNFNDALGKWDRADVVVDYDPSSMTSFPELSNEDIDDIFEYVANPPEGAIVPPGSTTKKKSGVNWLIVGLLLALFLLSLILAYIANNVERLAAERAGEPLPAQKPFGSQFFNKRLLAFLALASIGFLGFKAYQGAADLGRSKGYAPTQPIKYSHKLHAGDLKIDCQYCHFSASVSKSASIPSANICMNCHNGVSEGPTGDTNEIQKIYDATGWNPETRKYDRESTGAIEWVKIHNLPDHVFFSHAQHVTAGKVECQTCHGPIEEMEVVKQHSNLSMGWCLDCHKKTKVQFTDNAYYEETFKKFHKEAVINGNADFVTVDKIGGLECQKCHY